ncbi:MAG: ComEC/Rec2 family competence protein [Pirellulales bacterium]
MDGGDTQLAPGADERIDRAQGAVEPVPSRGREFRPRYQPLVAVLLAASAGIVIDRIGRPQFLSAAVEALGGSAWYLLWSMLGLLWLALWYAAWRQRRDLLAAWVLLGAVASAGAAWHHLGWFNFGRDDLARYAAFAPEPACIEAIACESAERVSAPQSTPLRAIPATERSRLMVTVTRIRDGRGWREASGSCQLAVNGHALWVRPGDRLRIFGQLARPAPPLNPGEFDFAANARANGQLTRIRCSAPECVVKFAAGSAWTPERWLDDARMRAKYLVRSFVGPRRAGLAAAILLGAREGLPFEETEPYLETGTVHVLVVSGMNVAILAIGLLAMMQLGWLPRRVGLAVIMAIVIAYTLLAESQPPVMRAAVLGVLACIAVWTGRKGMAFNSLFGAALVVLVLNPNDLFRAGPQLSFLAVAALIWAGSAWLRPAGSLDPLGELVAQARPWPARMLLRAKDWARALLVTSTGVWFVTLPLVLYTFHIVSPIAIPASLLVWPLVTIAMWSGFFMVLLGWLAPSIGEFCGTICNWSLAGLEALVHWAESLPLGHFWAPGPALWWVVVFYMGVIGAMIWGRAMLPARWQVAALAVWVIVGLVPAIGRSWTRAGLDVSFIAVGHGECVVLQTANGKTLLYDAGAIGSPEFATQSIASYLWHLGVMRIDGIVVSHADSDHYNAIPGLLERFRVGAVYVSPVMFRGIGEESTARGVEVLREAVDRAGVPIHEIWAGNRLELAPDLELRVLHPPQRGVLGSDNANSITLAIEFAGRRMLLPGDLESPGLDDLMAEQPYDCDILLAPHHGSRRSDPPGFATWTTPEWVVISGGGEDDIRTVVETYERAGAVALPTNDNGTIRFNLRAGSALVPAVWREESEPGAFHLAEIR